MSKWIEALPDIIRAASASTLGLAALSLLLIAALVYWMLRRTSRKARIITVGVFAAFCLVVLVITMPRAGKPADKTGVSVVHPSKQLGNSVSTGDVTQSGSVNVNGVGGNAEVQIAPAKEAGKTSPPQ
jgi:hypothetical protein